MTDEQVEKLIKVIRNYLNLHIVKGHDKAVEYAQNLPAELHQVAFHLVVGSMAKKLNESFEPLLQKLLTIPVPTEIGALAVDVLTYNYIHEKFGKDYAK